MRLHKDVPKKILLCSIHIKRFQKGNRDKKQKQKTERESDLLFPHVNIVNNDKCIKFAGGSE